MLTVLLAMGGIGLLVLVISLLIGEIDVDLDLGPDWLSLPVVAALVGAFGFAGAALLELTGSTLAAIGGGAVVGVALAAMTALMIRSLMRMRTDAPLRATDLVGRPGRVVTALTPDRSGEVLVHQAGQRIKLSAAGAETMTVGQEIVVVEVLSPTMVRVESHARFWSPTSQTDDSSEEPR